MTHISAAAKAQTPFGVQASRTAVTVHRAAEDLAVTELVIGGTPVSFAMSDGNLHAYITALIECANTMTARRLTRELKDVSA